MSEQPTDDSQFLAEVQAELAKARRKFPGQTDPWRMYAALGEEVGEVGKALLQEPPECVRAELVQAAAVAARLYVECDLDSAGSADAAAARVKATVRELFDTAPHTPDLSE
jgi:hypothetical protein